MKVKNFMKKAIAFCLGLAMTAGVGYGIAGNRASEVDADDVEKTAILDFTDGFPDNTEDDDLGHTWTHSMSGSAAHKDNSGMYRIGTNKGETSGSATFTLAISKLGSSVSFVSATFSAKGKDTSCGSLDVTIGSATKITKTVNQTSKSDFVFDLSSYTNQTSGNVILGFSTSTKCIDVYTITLKYKISGGEDTCKHESKTECPATSPTCSEPGNEKYYICSNDKCGKLFDEDGETEISAIPEIPALGHVWGDWEQNDSQTHIHYCTRTDCNGSETEEHSFGAVDAQGVHTCSVCNYSELAPIVVSFNIDQYVVDNELTTGDNGFSFKTNSVGLNDIISMTVEGGTGNTGKIYGTAPKRDMRLYSNSTTTGTLALNASGKYKMVGATFTFSVSNNGSLKYNNNSVVSKETVALNSNSAVFTFSGYSGGSQGQVRVTNIAVSYVVDPDAHDSISISTTDNKNIMSGSDSTVTFEAESTIADPTYNWAVDDEDLAQITSEGVLTAKQGVYGTVKVTANIDDVVSNEIEVVIYPSNAGVLTKEEVAFVAEQVGTSAWSSFDYTFEGNVTSISGNYVFLDGAEQYTSNISNFKVGDRARFYGYIQNTDIYGPKFGGTDATVTKLFYVQFYDKGVEYGEGFYAEQNSKLTKPADPTPGEDQKFDGWYVDDVKWDFDEDVVTEDLLIESKYLSTNVYTISYELDGGTVESENPTSYTKGVGVPSFNDAAKDGYTFDGWFDAPTGGNKVTSISTETEGNITLYARFTETSLHKFAQLETESSLGVLYDVEQKEDSGDKTVKMDYTTLGTSNILIKDGYTSDSLEGGFTLTYADIGSSDPGYYSSDSTMRFYEKDTITVSFPENVSNIKISYTAASGKDKLSHTSGLTNCVWNEDHYDVTEPTEDVVITSTGTGRYYDITIDYTLEKSGKLVNVYEFNKVDMRLGLSASVLTNDIYAGIASENGGATITYGVELCLEAEFEAGKESNYVYNCSPVSIDLGMQYAVLLKNVKDYSKTVSAACYVEVNGVKTYAQACSGSVKSIAAELANLPEYANYAEMLNALAAN